ncbi:M67 family metallopeptidase [Cytobacillus firmus]|uniref:Mov34/MPN/PAD-1 family protein n=1 Tax=Cytobacillus firmus TaxID=1399 RepID=UPI001C944665|nr:M67 family metallopeptidase [Cytobacillus firmus]USK41221.1 M67 family metallopeptidase [Cytobacillus firmus]
MTQHAQRQIINHCQHELPFEACGIISGRNGKADTVWPVENISRSTVAFSMSIEDISYVFEQSEMRRQSVMGIYHSHPTAYAVPSRGDIAYNNYPNLAHIIVSLSGRNPTMKLYEINRGRVRQLTLKLY